MSLDRVIYRQPYSINCIIILRETLGPVASGPIIGTNDGNLHLLDIHRPRVKKTFYGHTGPVTCVADINLDAENIRGLSSFISGSEDKTLRVWNSFGEIVKEFIGHTSPVRCVCITGTHNESLVSASSGKTIRLWDKKTGKTIRTFRGHTDVINCLTKVGLFYFLSGSDDGTLRLWNVYSDKRLLNRITDNSIKVFRGHTGSVTCVTVLANANGNFISGSEDDTLRLWDIQTGETIRIFEGHNSFVTCVTQLRDGNFVSGDSGGILRLWNVQSGETIKIFEGHTKAVRCLTPLQHGKNFLSGSDDGTLRLWDNTSLPIQLPPPVQVLRNIPRGSTNGISLDEIQEGNAMINFPRNNTGKSEYNYNSYLKNTPYIRGLRLNPYSRKALTRKNFRYYTAHLVNAIEGEANAIEGAPNAIEGAPNAIEGGKKKTRRNKKRKTKN